jgi:hypothetical protein
VDALGLEHLNESHGNIQVRRVAKPEKGTSKSMCEL